MSDDNSKLIGLYDELAMFHPQINVFRGRGVSDSHELPCFCNFMVEAHGIGELVCMIWHHILL